MVKVIKVSDQFYNYLVRLIRRDFGRVSVPKGLFEVVKKYEIGLRGYPVKRDVIVPKNRNLKGKEMFTWGIR